MCRMHDFREVGEDFMKIRRKPSNTLKRAKGPAKSPRPISEYKPATKVPRATAPLEPRWTKLL